MYKIVSKRVLYEKVHSKRFYDLLPTIYFLIKRFLEFSNQLPKPDFGFIINPLRISTCGFNADLTQPLQILAFFPIINFDTSAFLFPQKLQLAVGFVFRGKNKLCSIQLKQIESSAIPASKPLSSHSLLPQKLQLRT